MEQESISHKRSREECIETDQLAKKPRFSRWDIPDSHRAIILNELGEPQIIINTDDVHNGSYIFSTHCPQLYKREIEQFSILACACHDATKSDVVKRCLELGVNPNSKKRFGALLDIACRKNNIEAVRYLLEYGAKADVHFQSSCRGPLFYMIKEYNVEMVKLLCTKTIGQELRVKQVNDIMVSDPHFDHLLGTSGHYAQPMQRILSILVFYGADLTSIIERLRFGIKTEAAVESHRGSGSIRAYSMRRRYDALSTAVNRARNNMFMLLTKAHVTPFLPEIARTVVDNLYPVLPSYDEISK